MANLNLEHKLTSTTRFLIILTFVSCISLGYSFSYEYEFMDIDCRFHGLVNNHAVDVAIKLLGGEADGSFKGTCSSILRSVSAKRLVLNVYRLDMPPDYYVRIYDGQLASDPLLSSDPLSGKEEDPEHVFRSSGQFMRVDITGTGIRDYSYDGFAAHVTEFTEGECASDEYKCCRSGECISDELRKDSYNNCYDNSDEWEVSSCLNAGQVAGIVIGSLAGAAILCGILIYCCYRSQQKKNTARAPAASGSYPTQATGTGSYPTQPAAQFSNMTGPQVQMSGVGYNPGPPAPPGAYAPQPGYMYQPPPPFNPAAPPPGHPGYPGYPAAGNPAQPPTGIPAQPGPGVPPQPPTGNPSLPPPAYPGPGQSDGAALPKEPEETEKPVLQ